MVLGRGTGPTSSSLIRCYVRMKPSWGWTGERPAAKVRVQLYFRLFHNGSGKGLLSSIVACAGVAICPRPWILLSRRTPRLRRPAGRAPVRWGGSCSFVDKGCCEGAAEVDNRMRMCRKRCACASMSQAIFTNQVGAIADVSGILLPLSLSFGRLSALAWG